MELSVCVHVYACVCVCVCSQRGELGSVRTCSACLRIAGDRGWNLAPLLVHMEP